MNEFNQPGKDSGMTVKGRNVTLSMTQVPFRSRGRYFAKPRTKSGGNQARAYEIYLEGDGLQAMSLMIGTGLNANSKRSLSSPKTGIAFRRLAPSPKAETDISATWKRLKGQSDDDADDFRKGSRVEA